MEIKLPENCINFSKTDQCHSWLKENFRRKNLSSLEIYLLSSQEQEKAIQICAKCPYYKKREDSLDKW